MESVNRPHLVWLAKTFGRTDYLPLTHLELQALSNAGSYVEKYPGSDLFKQGELSVAAYVIEKGEVELYRTSATRSRQVGRVRLGTVVGDIAMFRGEPYLSSARAISHVRAFRLERSRLIPVLIEYPAITMRWLVAGLRQLEATQRRVVQLMHSTVREQVAEMLLEEADEFGEVHITQRAIADALGASRQSVTIALARLQELGGTENGYRRIQITNDAVLARVSGRTIG